MKTFYRLLGIALIVVTTNNFVWFALTFWAYLTTKSVITTSVLAGIFLVLDRHLGASGSARSSTTTRRST